MSEVSNPDDWIVKFTADNIPFYYNKKEKKSYWEKPECLKSVAHTTIPVTPAASKSEWTEHKTSDGRTFYYSSVLKKSVWTKPLELSQAESVLNKTPTQPDGQQSNNADAPVQVAVEVMTKTVEEVDGNMESTSKENKEVNQDGGITFQLEIDPIEIEEEEEADTAGIDTSKTMNDQQSKGNEVNIEDGKKIFLALMKEKGVNPSMKWSQVHDLLKREERYKALPKISDKKKVYNEYLIQLKKNEKLQAKQKHEQARADFRTMLSEFKEMRSDTKYTKIVQIIYNDPRFKAIEMKDREMLFQDYLDELLEREKNEYFAKRKQMVLKMKEHFAELGSIITIDTKWDEAVNLLRHNAVWNELPDIDKLEAFSEYITGKEREEADARRQRRLEEEKRRRIEYRAFLRHKIRQDELSFKTKWKHFVKENQENPTLLAMLRNFSGSTAREIFHDARRKLLEKNKTLKENFKKVLVRVGANLNPNLSVGEFETELRKHPEFVESNSEDCNSLSFYAAYLLDKYALRVKHAKEKYYKTIPKVCPDYSLETTVQELDKKIIEEKSDLREYFDCLRVEDKTQILEEVNVQLRNKKTIEQIFPELLKRKAKRDSEAKHDVSNLKKRVNIEQRKKENDGKPYSEKHLERGSVESSSSNRNRKLTESRRSEKGSKKLDSSENEEGEEKGKPEDGFEEGEVVDLPKDVKRQLQKTQTKHKRKGGSRSRSMRSSSSSKQKGHRN